MEVVLEADNDRSGDVERELYEHRHDQHHERAVVALAHTVVDPDAVVVEAPYAAVALPAVLAGLVAVAIAVAAIQVVAVHEGLPT